MLIKFILIKYKQYTFIFELFAVMIKHIIGTEKKLYNYLRMFHVSQVFIFLLFVSSSPNIFQVNN